MRNGLVVFIAWVCCIVLAGCAPRTAQVAVTFDMGGGSAGFAAMIYAQEVSSGKVFKVFYPAGSHGGVILPTSPPVTLTVDAPGTYVFYALLSNDPESYHYGATGCAPATDCPSKALKALEVQPGKSYAVTIADRAALLPEPGSPVTVPIQTPSDSPH
jgi:hypothetical protein